MKYKEYNRTEVVQYAQKWALSRNPKYYNFDNVGGDCTSFVSQCILAGSKTMNYTKDIGWYYINGNNKSPSWSGVEYLYQFLVTNKGIGPQAIETTQNKIEVGDIAQVSFDGERFSHTLMIVKIENKFIMKGIQIASHTFDSLNKPISEYDFEKIRWIHIQRVGI
ncbi:MAG: amidase domain-containing protein [Clostridia bacterium]|nr:amidase domain-containing protein [Clostridia bacterium]